MIINDDAEFDWPEEEEIQDASEEDYPGDSQIRAIDEDGWDAIPALASPVKPMKTLNSPVSTPKSFPQPSPGSSARRQLIEAACREKTMSPPVSPVVSRVRRRMGFSSPLKHGESFDSVSTDSTSGSSMLVDSRTTSMDSLESTKSMPTAGPSGRKRSFELLHGQGSGSQSSSKVRKTAKPVNGDMPWLNDDVVMTPARTQPPSFSSPVDEPSVFRDSPTPARPIARPAAPSSAKPSPYTQAPRAPYMSEPPLPALAIPMPSTPWGTALNTFVIAHDALVQEIMDKKGLNWGTQYEIARGITQGHWTWDQLKRNGAKLLSDLRGPNVQAAPLVRHVIMSAPASSDGVHVWKELDREQAALEEGLGRGLGLMGEWEGVEDWYGGKIQQVARVALDNNNKELTIRLEKMEMRKSTAAARFLSSRRMLQIRVPADLMRSRGAQVRQFLQQRFVLCGRMFVPFHAKDRSVYLMEINEDYERKHERPSSFADDSRISLEDFINWANPLHVNDKQPIRKWSTRLTLYLSTSVPALEFDAENILFIDDEYAPHQGKPQAEEIMTDGCGFINLSGLEAIKQFFRYNLRPTAVQGRIAGSKGLWTLHPDDRDTKNPPRIWIRSSQRKIQFSPAVKNYRSHKIFNFLAPDRVTEPARSSRQSIINMAHNCVPHGAFIDLMRLTMAEEAKKFMEMRPSVAAQTVLLDAVDKAGHVVGARLQRQSKGLARAYGLAGRDFGNDDLGPDDEEDSAEDGVTDIPGRSDYNKAPRSIYEAAYEMLQSGFNHQYSPLLYTKLQLILKYILDSYVNEYHITLPESAEAFCIPDPYGVLEEGELYFRTTSGEIYTGDVLVYRNPARLPSDVRKMKAVNHPALGEYPNVIVFSTKGSRSAASWLGGGDYDGDTVVITKFLPLVEPFVNPLFFPAPPDFLEKNFEKDVELVPAFLARIRNMSPQVAQEAFQGILLLSLADTKVGLYSTFHDYAVYIFGYDHPFTIRLAYMFTTELDSSKTGLRIKRDVFDKDQKAFGQPRPECLDPSTKQPPKRNTIKLGDFVLDALLEVGKKERADHLTQYEHLPTQHKVPDNDLRLPYETAVQAARSEAIRVYGRIPYKENGVVKYYPAADIYGGLEHELQRIISHVKQVFNSHWPPAKIGSTSSKNRYNDQTKKKADLYDQVACAFHNGPQPFEDEDGFLGFLTPNVEEVKASYAYIRPEHKDTFGFAVAFKELCGIKARAASHSTIRQPIAEAMALKSSHVRLLQKEEDN